MAGGPCKEAASAPGRYLCQGGGEHRTLASQSTLTSSKGKKKWRIVRSPVGRWLTGRRTTRRCSKQVADNVVTKIKVSNASFAEKANNALVSADLNVPEELGDLGARGKH